MWRVAGGIYSTLGVEAASWGDDAVVSRSGGFPRGSTGYAWSAWYTTYAYCNQLNLNLGFSL